MPNGETDIVVMPFDLAPGGPAEHGADHDAYWCGLGGCPDEHECPHLVAT